MNNKTFIPFGKYKGELLSDVTERDPQYVLWMQRVGKWLEQTGEPLPEYVVDRAQRLQDELDEELENY